MRVEVVELLRNLRPEHLRRRAVVVFDVLRATTSMVTALANGADRIVVFDSLDAARHVHAQPRDSRSSLLCGEERCLKPADFDLGNSPGGFEREVVEGKTIFMCTTNGTRAIVAARGAAELFAAALVNATATAQHLARLGRDVTLLCSGTEGEVAPEDLIGAGAVVDRLCAVVPTTRVDDAARASRERFKSVRPDLLAALRDTRGGRNIIRAGLSGDIEVAARLDVYDVVAVISSDSPPVVQRRA